MKIAIITGASSGLGVEYTKAVIEKNSDLDEIWVIARRKERLEQMMKESQKAKVRPVPLDLSLNESYEQLGQMLEDEKPEIRVLINNAGYEQIGKLEVMKSSDITGIIDLNVKGLTMVDRICFPYMKKGAIVIHTCSVSSFCPIPSQAVYSASKIYVRFLSRALREEMQHKGINVMMICPGNMDTEMNPKDGGSQSKSVDRLPFLNMRVITRKSLDKAVQGKAIYTPGMFYKFYRVASKLLPSAWMIKITGKSYGF